MVMVAMEMLAMLNVFLMMMAMVGDFFGYQEQLPAQPPNVVRQFIDVLHQRVQQRGCLHRHVGFEFIQAHAYVYICT